MNSTLIIAVILLAMAVGAAISGNLFFTMMIGELNRKRTDDNQISQFFFTPTKVINIWKEYRRQYPGGRFLRLVYISGLIALCLFIAFLCVMSHISRMH